MQVNDGILMKHSDIRINLKKSPWKNRKHITAINIKTNNHLNLYTYILIPAYLPLLFFQGLNIPNI